MAETQQKVPILYGLTKSKVYPHKQEDIAYEQEIVDAIKKLPLEQRLQAVALNNYCLIKKQIEDNMDGEIDKIIEKYNKIHRPLMDKVPKSQKFTHISSATKLLPVTELPPMKKFKNSKSI